MQKKIALPRLISALTIGSALEWYEIFLYIYWAPQLSELFFAKSYGHVALIEAFLVFAFGFIARPIGGLLFGYIGDRYGRKKALITSILLCIIPVVVIACLPTYATLGITAQIILSIARFLQGIPAGGELPGAMIYLKETAPESKKFFITSFSFIGAQTGGVLALSICFLFQMYMSPENILAYGWRLCFAIGGLIGLLGFFLRSSLKESPQFQKLKKEHHLVKKPLSMSFIHHRRPMLIAFFITIFQVISYFMVAIFPSLFYKQIFALSSSQNLFMTVGVLSFSALTIALFGKLGDVISTKKLMVTGALFTFLLSICLYTFITHASFTGTLVTQYLLVLSLNAQIALLPQILTGLFPTSVRFSCLGFSFNLCDSLIGSLTPVMALCSINYAPNPGSFVALLSIAAILNIWLFTGARAKAIIQKKFDLFFRCVDHANSQESKR